MKTKIILIALVLGGIVLFSLYAYHNRTGDLMNIVENIPKVYEELEEIEKEYQAMYENITIDQTNEGYLPIEISSEQNQLDSIGVIQLMFSAIITEDIDLFSTVFYPSRFSDAIFSVDEPDKYKVVTDIMNAISKNGSIQDIAILSTRSNFGKTYEDVKIKIYYQDGTNAIVTLNTELSEINHDSVGKMTMIMTSVWDIIAAIEGEESGEENGS